jgi:hypothetical protein
VLEGSAITERLTAVGELLIRHRPVWSASPWRSLPPAWAADHAEVAGWLKGFDSEALDRHESAPHQLHGPPAWIAWREQTAALATIGPLPSAAIDPFAARQVPGRKLVQVNAFARAVAPALQSPTLVEWCSGKGHLGRLLAAATGRSMVGVERDGVLCAAGQALAAEEGLRAQFVCGDAHIDGPAALSADRDAIALHACGSLTERLLVQGTLRGCATLAASPCCYHRTEDETYRPLSTVAQAQDPALSRAHTHFCTVVENTASPKVRRRRRTELAWRHGLDLLLREATGVDAYRPLHSVPRQWKDLPFEDFVERMVERHGLALPPRWDAGTAEAAGWERARQSRAYALPPGLFRRVIELYIVLDRAQWLLEQGRTAQVGTFCPPEITHRNLLILSTRRSEGSPS